MIDFLGDLIEPGMNVLEFGAGGSTLFFLDRGATVTTTKTSSDSIAVVKGEIDQEAEERLKIVELSPYEEDPDVVYFEFVKRANLAAFEMVLDHPEVEPALTSRRALFSRIEPRIKPGG